MRFAQMTMRAFLPIGCSLLLLGTAVPETFAYAVGPGSSGQVFEGRSFSSGSPLVAWRQGADGVWEHDAPRDADGKLVFFEQLFVNGRRASRSPWPKRGFTHLKTASCTSDGKNRFLEKIEFADRAAVDVLKGLSEAEQKSVQVIACVKWSFNLRNVESFDAARGEVCLVNRSRPWPSWGAWQPLSDIPKACPTLVRLENVRTAFAEPGEWLYDVPRAKLMYRPLSGERLETAQVVATLGRNVPALSIVGTPENPVGGVVFRNCIFEYAPVTDDDDNVTAFAQIYGWQAARQSGGLVEMRYARNVRFEDCVFRHCGGYGLKMGDGCVSNVVVNCRFEDLGAGGIMIGREKANPDITFTADRLGERVPPRTALPTSVSYDKTTEAVAFNVISNSSFSSGGRVNAEGVGVFLTHASDTRIIHCDIHDFYYTGVSLGYVWGYYGSAAQRNEVAFCHIWDIGKGVMADLGGVYTLGTSFGTTVHDNVVHDIRSGNYGGWGLYNDEGSEGVTWYNNLVYDVSANGYFLHYGRHNIVKNNIFAFSDDWSVVRTGTIENHTQVLYLNNIFYQGSPSDDKECPENVLCWDEGLHGYNPGVRYVGNVWWRADGAPRFPWRIGFDKWQARGNDLGGAAVDPRFVDAERRDFRLRQDSPVLEMDFKPFDYTRAGCRLK